MACINPKGTYSPSGVPLLLIIYSPRVAMDV